MGFFLFATAVSRPALEPTQPPVYWIPEVLTPGVKLPRRETYTHLHLVARLRMRGATSPLHRYDFMAGCLRLQGR
jgi:hypothetical protein